MQQQQQEILFRKTTFSLLSRIEPLHKEWESYQTATLATLSTLANIQQQQHITSKEDTTHRLEQKYDIDAHRLLYTQTQRFEAAMLQLQGRLDQWYQVLEGWQRLAFDAQHNAIKAQKMNLANNTGSLVATSTQAAPLSSHTLIQMVTISPTEAHHWIMHLEYLYKEQYHRKKMLLLLLSTTSQEADINNIMDQWSSTNSQQRTILQNIAERLNLYKQVKKTVESV